MPPYHQVVVGEIGASQEGINREIPNNIGLRVYRTFFRHMGVGGGVGGGNDSYGVYEHFAHQARRF